MILELDAVTLLGYLEDPPTIRGLVSEAMKVISGPPPSAGSRLQSYTGFDPSSTLTSLGDADSMLEGDHDNDQKES
jgi:hypothetical protein